MQFFDQGGNGKVSIMEFTDILNRYCEFLDEPLDIEDVKVMLVDAGFDINTKWLTPEELHSLLSSGSESESE
jgi:Ca2+-binding EF-hand superfamily protein